jgi:hypothetical protein
VAAKMSIETVKTTWDRLQLNVDPPKLAIVVE